ncbi:Hypothetical protein NTJ_05960 [Nesidiocoris tenuis]|uniref:Uncharacterized protein n=1 Tax=Nesidiocoris tenuis TaxID=355587 RepID=A0ABN7AQG5_9HEMI|nr:Hypothetical protein NTJ_05960 [Nesidiocoris tenuis]
MRGNECEKTKKSQLFRGSCHPSVHGSRKKSRTRALVEFAAANCMEVLSMGEEEEHFASSAECRDKRRQETVPEPEGKREQDASFFIRIATRALGYF